MNQKQNSTQNNKAIAFFSFLAVLTVGISSVWGSSITVSGTYEGNHTWDVDTVYVTDTTRFKTNASDLTVKPGTHVLASENVKLIIGGNFTAVGTETDSIHFTALDTNQRWAGLSLNADSDTPIKNLKYVTISYSSKRGIIFYTPTNLSHSRISNNNGGGIYGDPGFIAKLTNLHISKNRAGRGGGQTSL